MCILILIFEIIIIKMLIFSFFNCFFKWIKIFRVFHLNRSSEGIHFAHLNIRLYLLYLYLNHVCNILFWICRYYKKVFPCKLGWDRSILFFYLDVYDNLLYSINLLFDCSYCSFLQSNLFYLFKFKFYLK